MSQTPEHSSSGHHPAASAAGLLFDDQPLEAVLYGEPSPGPSSADLFAAARAETAAIDAAIASDDLERALRLIAALLAGEAPVPIRQLRDYVKLPRDFVPAFPRPVIAPSATPLDRILKPCMTAALRAGDAALVSLAGTRLYRWYEAVERYDEAAEIVTRLIADARRRGDSRALPSLVNNLGYEHLLARRWAEAEPYFREASDLFAAQADDWEVVNCRVNLLACQGGLHGPGWLAEHKEALREIASVLYGHRDWRVRKPLMLLARAAEWEGRCARARRYAQAAVAAAQHVPTQHHLEDQAYLSALQAKRAASTGTEET